MGAAASVDKRKHCLEEFAKNLDVDEREMLQGALNKPFYTLYVRDTGSDSMRVMIFILEAKLSDKVEIVNQTKIPQSEIDTIKSQNADAIKALTAEGKTWLPCLKFQKSYIVGGQAIIDYLAEKNKVQTDRFVYFPMFEYGMYKDYNFMHGEMQRLAGDDAKEESDVLAWYSALDKDGDGRVELDEIIMGLDATRLLAEARRGAVVNTASNRWRDTLSQVNHLTHENPGFIEGWRTAMLLGTICDAYDLIISSADKVVELDPGDSQALTLKALYCMSLGRAEGFESAMKGLRGKHPKIGDMADRLVKRVDKYWSKELTHDVPRGITGKAAIVALGSPADDDGTPRPRLMGTLNKTLEAAKMYPEIDIFVTGAAVSSNMAEAIAMKKWLGHRGVDTKRVTMEMKAMDTVGNYEYIAPMLKDRGVTKVILITVYYHLNRSSALADAVFENKGVSVEVIGVAGVSDLKDEVLTKRMGVERPASYRDVARACGLYEYDDHAALTKA
mmetsp:Transcript_62494/g.176253  ORF Transcript_62494/g.176253 Transcript_62494/m.176253 type:complete len:502 (-) Transcript_62494:92-1597(-)